MSFFTLDTPTRIAIDNPQFVIVESTRDVTQTMENLGIKDAYLWQETQIYHLFAFPLENGGNTWWKPAGFVYLNIELSGIYHISAMDPTDWTLREIFINAQIGDLNFDGRVTVSDFIDLASNFGKANALWYEGDLNLDGTVTISDFIDLASNLSSVPPPQPASVPEPVLLTVISGFILARRRR